MKARALQTLKWIEHYTKTDMVYLVKGSFWGTLSQIAVTGMTFGLAIAFARFIPKETYGQYKYILSFISLLSTLTLSGLSVAVLQSVSHGYEGTLSYAFWKNIKWSIFFFAGAGIVSIYYFTHSNFVLASSMLIAGCLWPFFNSSNFYSPFLVAKKDFRRLTVYFDLIGNLVPSMCLLITMFLTTNPLWFVIVYIISNTVIGLISYRRIVSIYRPNNDVDPGMLNYSKHLSVMGIIAGISDNLDQILVFHYIGAVQLAIYSFATAIPDQIKGPMKNLTNMIFPKFAEQSEKEIRAGMLRKCLILLGVSIILILIYVIIAPFIFHLFFSKYNDSIFYSQLFSVSLLYIVAIPVNTYLSVKKKIRELYIINVSVSIIQIIVLFVAIVKWGLLGLIITRVCVRIISALASIVLYNSPTKDTVSMINVTE